MKTLHMLACDMGAGNGRIVYGILEDGTLIIRELHRFVNRPVRLGGVLYWDFLQLFQEIKNGLAAAAKEGLPIECAHIASHICVKRGIDKNLPLARQWARY